ncbi:hypothetical protein JR316_0012302 [Psilocybe cubensis]|uniref:Uncharacterized protein n=2 Tax=Psilocybe cubensis TaxID=181762 RepID=A0ACB8GHQ3_PSICU|nr:hypothetical protein JR316_0012302 [Psilocybe cubensis]KAH9475191.1 hypothetical protein JR316_0012302 [Psilocybe cubensis]
MPTSAGFPWELLKAECLRLICMQIVQGSKEGGAYQGVMRKESMIEFLRDVDKRGLEPALKTLGKTQALRKPLESSSPEETSSPKRKSSRLEEADGEGDTSLAHNTRFKGTKRVKLTKEDPDPTPITQTKSPRKKSKPRKSTDTAADGTKRSRGRPRKSVDAVGSTSPKKSKATPKKKAPLSESAADEAGSSNKRGPGRPRKSAKGAPAPQSKAKSIFDGVLLEPRRTSAGVPAVQSEEPKQTLETENAVQEDVVLATFINHVENNDASSLGGSNKENDPNDYVAPDVHDDDADADGEPDPQIIGEVPATT